MLNAHSYFGASASDLCAYKMGSRPSSNSAGSNGTLTTQADAALRNENNQLKEKLNALEELQPAKIKQENEELRTANKELKAELDVLRESTSQGSRQLNSNSNDHQNNSQHSNHETKERDRSTRRINSTLVSQRLSDIDAYGQGIPLEKHPPIKIKSHRKRHNKRTTSEEVGDCKIAEASLGTDKEQSQETNKKDGHGDEDNPGNSAPDVNITIGDKKQLDSGQSGGVATLLPDDDQDKKSCLESDLLL